MPVAVKTFKIDLKAPAAWAIDCKFEITVGGRAIKSDELKKLRLKAELWDFPLHVLKVTEASVDASVSTTVRLDGGIAGALFGIPAAYYVDGIVLNKETGEQLASARSTIWLYDSTYSDPDLPYQAFRCKYCYTLLPRNIPRVTCPKCHAVYKRVR